MQESCQATIYALAQRPMSNYWQLPPSFNARCPSKKTNKKKTVVAPKEVRCSIVTDLSLKEEQ